MAVARRSSIRSRRRTQPPPWSCRRLRRAAGSSPSSRSSRSSSRRRRPQRAADTTSWTGRPSGTWWTTCAPPGSAGGPTRRPKRTWPGCETGTRTCWTGRGTPGTPVTGTWNIGRTNDGRASTNGRFLKSAGRRRFFFLFSFVPVENRTICSLYLLESRYGLICKNKNELKILLFPHLFKASTIKVYSILHYVLCTSKTTEFIHF